MALFTPPRSGEEELLDQGFGSEEDVRLNLVELRRANRLLGGARAVIRTLETALSADPPRELSLLDIGTGSADMPALIAEWCRKRGINPAIVAADNSARNMMISRSRLGIAGGVDLVLADAMRLPFAERSFDYVLASQFLHHFSDDEVTQLLASLATVARRAVLVTDLIRGIVPYWVIRLIGPVVTPSPLSRRDGPLSVLRGFTVEEITAHARRSGLINARVERCFPYRFSLVASVVDGI